MFNTGKCPFCQNVISQVNVEDIDVYAGFQHRWQGFSYLCRSCKSVLSVQMNPITLNEELEQDLLKKFQKLLP